MTDNEKRAHDLAILSIQIAYDQAKSIDGAVIDIPTEYFDLYTTYLHMMNQKFVDKN